MGLSPRPLVLGPVLSIIGRLHTEAAASVGERADFNPQLSCSGAVALSGLVTTLQPESISVAPPPIHCSSIALADFSACFIFMPRSGECINHRFTKRKTLVRGVSECVAEQCTSPVAM